MFKSDLKTVPPPHATASTGPDRSTPNYQASIGMGSASANMRPASTINIPDAIGQLNTVLRALTAVAVAVEITAQHSANTAAALPELLEESYSKGKLKGFREGLAKGSGIGQHAPPKLAPKLKPAKAKPVGAVVGKLKLHSYRYHGPGGR